MTKSELREMIRECLREELSKVNLKEAATGFRLTGPALLSIEDLADAVYRDDDPTAIKKYASDKAIQEVTAEDLAIAAENSDIPREIKYLAAHMKNKGVATIGEFAAGLREEFSEVNLKEGAFSGGVAGDTRFGGGTVRGRGASTQPGKKNYLDRLKSKNPDLVDTTIVKGKDIKPGMITQAGQVQEAEVRKNNKGETKVYIMHTNNYDGFWDVDEDMPVMVDPDDKSKPFTGKFADLKAKGLEEGIFGNNYKGKDILTYKGNGKDEAIAIADSNAENYNLMHFKQAHAKKNGNKEADYQVVAATDVAVKKYNKTLKSIPDVTSTVPGWVKQYVDDSKAKHAQGVRNAQREKEQEAEARRYDSRYKNMGKAKNPDDDYIYTKGNGSGTYKYREDLEESLAIDNIFENLY